MMRRCRDANLLARAPRRNHHCAFAYAPAVRRRPPQSTAVRGFAGLCRAACDAARRGRSIPLRGTPGSSGRLRTLRRYLIDTPSARCVLWPRSAVSHARGATLHRVCRGWCRALSKRCRRVSMTCRSVSKHRHRIEDGDKPLRWRITLSSYSRNCRIDARRCRRMSDAMTSNPRASMRVKRAERAPERRRARPSRRARARPACRGEAPCALHAIAVKANIHAAFRWIARRAAVRVDGAFGSLRQCAIEGGEVSREAVRRSARRHRIDAHRPRGGTSEGVWKSRWTSVSMMLSSRCVSEV